ncbi:MAG: hypothetical protein ACRDI2_11595 [Chloroflexota bacterium]
MALGVDTRSETSNETSFAMFAGGAAPDAITINNDAVPDYATRSVVQPLHPKWHAIDTQALRPELRPVFQNTRSPQEGVKLVTEKAKAILASS